jgi:AcrR family transcriptional regulator
MTPSTSLVHESEAAERIVQAAAILFAEKGFKGVTTREIAQAVGLNIGTVHYHVGTKRDLYLKVYAWACESERQAIAKVLDEAAMAPPQPPRGLAARLIDKVVDFTAADTVRIRFLLRHWLDAGGHPDTEEVEDSLRVFHQIGALLQQAQEGGLMNREVDTSLFLRGFFGILYSYFAFGAFSWELGRGDPHSGQNLRALKGFLHQYVFQLLGLSDV